MAPADYVFACTNELGQSETQMVFAQVPPRGKGVYGCGGSCTLNFASLRDEFTHIGIFDINPKVGLFWMRIVKILTKEGLTLSDAKNEIFTYLKNDPNALSELHREIHDRLSFLSTELRFERIRKLLHNFSFTRLNFYDPTAVGAFLETQRARGATFHMFYISNISAITCSKSPYAALADKVSDYSRYSGLERSLALLPKHAIVIDARQKLPTDDFYTQRIHLKPQKLMPPPCRCAYGQALMSDDYTAVTSCVQNGASPDATTQEDGYTVLMWTAEKCKNNSVRALLDAEANVHAVDHISFTALHLAAQEGNVSGIELLLHAKADVNARSAQLMTPLHSAATAGQRIAAALLVQVGADTRARDNHNYTPVQLTELPYFPACALRTSDPCAYRSLRQVLKATPLQAARFLQKAAPSDAAGAGGPALPGSSTSSSSSSSSSGTASAHRSRPDRKAPKK